MNLFVAPDCYPYTAICTIENVLCFDLFSKYTDEITKDQKEIVDRELEKHYGLVNVDVDALVDYRQFEYRDDGFGYKKWFNLANPTESEEK